MEGITDEAAILTIEQTQTGDDPKMKGQEKNIVTDDGQNIEQKEVDMDVEEHNTQKADGTPTRKEDRKESRDNNEEVLVTQTEEKEHAIRSRGDERGEQQVYIKDRTKGKTLVLTSSDEGQEESPHICE